ncbi:MAG: multicopper oxidase domain-containing protein [Bradymonadaceae bacterium]|nr:multicopper oxidase domain-containing protein [Lujinxingiaceae bacterium]
MENQRGLPLRELPEDALAQATVQGQVLAQATPRPVAAARPVSVAGAKVSADTLNPIFEGAEFIDIIRRDEALSIPATSFVPQDTTPDKSFTVVLNEGQTYIGQGVMYNGFLIDGSVPGQTIVVQEGDIVEMKITNAGTVPHGASIHAAYTQTSKYVGNIAPGETKSVVFRANTPGVYMYHCAPGGHAIPMHVLFGQYGMIVVEPKQKYKLEEELGHPPDINLYLIQHEFYASGRDAIEGKPMYTAFNGKLFRYVEEPIVAKPGDYVRINFLNIGPNLTSTFHIVGIIWDYVYWQGNPNAMMQGGQSVTAGPSDTWVIEFRVPPDEGAYLMLSHAVGSTARGAIGVLVADAKAQTPRTILADGPKFTEAEIKEMAAKAVRTISPFDIGNSPVDKPVVYGPETKEVFVKIIGNSYHPKVIEIAPGTKVTWQNEDVFTYMAGEFSGIHNAVGIEGPERFATNLLAHAESDSFTFTKAGDYKYMCAPHPYMKGAITVREPAKPAAAAGGCSITSSDSPLAPLAPVVLIVLVLAGVTVVCARKGRI